MARYKKTDMSPRLLPVNFEAQLVPGSFAHALHHLVDQLDLSAFDAHYRNDEVGASAHAPAMLLKAVLLAYSQGMISSCAIERACRDNVLFIALTGDAKPHFTTGQKGSRVRKGQVLYCHAQSDASIQDLTPFHSLRVQDPELAVTDNLAVITAGVSVALVVPDVPAANRLAVAALWE